jgi:hypothetical protein
MAAPDVAVGALASVVGVEAASALVEVGRASAVVGVGAPGGVGVEAVSPQAVTSSSRTTNMLRCRSCRILEYIFASPL